MVSIIGVVKSQAGLTRDMPLLKPSLRGTIVTKQSRNLDLPLWGKKVSENYYGHAPFSPLRRRATSLVVNHPSPCDISP